MSTFSVLFNDRVKNQLKMDYSTVAKGLGVSNYAVWGWSSGKSLPRLQMYFCLCDFIGVEYDYFMDISDPVKKPGNF